MKRFLSVLLIVGSGLFVISCTDAVNTVCDSCDSMTPWSHPDISSCYATKADCEAANPGKTCVLCN